jgi:energy-coupling factor transport system ATP-binding protein
LSDSVLSGVDDAVLQLKGYGYAYPGTEGFVFEGVDLEIGAGECHCLVGDTGSGKTTLIQGIKGLLAEGMQVGEITFPANGRVGVVLQNPETQLLADSVGAEVAFGLENLGVEPASMPARVEEALARVGLEERLDAPVERLSMGQKYRLIVAGLLAMEPDLLILDEPSAQLDREGLERLLETIRELKRAGIAFLLCEHRPEWVAGMVDGFWRLDGKKVASWQPEFEEEEIPRTSPVALESGVELEVVGVRELAVEFAEGRSLWGKLSFALGRGEQMAVCGRNGAGKTTLLRCMTGFVRPTRGEVRIFGGEPRPEALRGRVGCLFQDPGRQLFENTVAEEVAFTLKRLGMGGWEDRVEETLALCGIEALADRSPHKLSYGQKHLVALACVLAPGPELLLLDDPFAGLDAERTERVLGLIEGASAERGTAVVWAIHDRRSLPDGLQLILDLEEGEDG